MLDKIRKTEICICAACSLCFFFSCSDPSTNGDAQANKDAQLADAQQDARTVDNGAEDSKTVAQNPINFVIRNTSSVTVFLDWQHQGNTALTGERTIGGAWEPIDYLEPSSCLMLACEGADPNSPEACHPPPCGIMFAAREIGPGDEVVVSWEAKHVYTADTEYCEPKCYWAHNVTPTKYKAVACAYDSYKCFSGSQCGPNNGIYEVANVEGDGRCFNTEFTIPYDQDQVVVEVN